MHISPIIFSALLVALYLEAGRAHLHAIMLNARLDPALSADADTWCAHDLPAGERFARSCAVFLYFVFWPLVLLVCSLRSTN